MDAPTRVLIVSNDDGLTERISTGLEDVGDVVTYCPGPQAPTFVCSGVRCETCALVNGADVVVVDGWLKSDEARRGVPSWHLARFYSNHGLPVVLLAGPDGLPAGITTDRIVALQRDADTADILRAVGSLSGPTGGVATA